MIYFSAEAVGKRPKEPLAVWVSYSRRLFIHLRRSLDTAREVERSPA